MLFATTFKGVMRQGKEFFMILNTKNNPGHFKLLLSMVKTNHINLKGYSFSLMLRFK